MTNITSNKINDIIQEMKNRAYAFLGLVILTAIYSVKFNNYQALYIITPIAFSAIAIILTSGLADAQMKREERAEEIRCIERRLELFYWPLQKLLNDYVNNSSTSYDKSKYDEIGHYRHLAEPDALCYFETCPQTNENLKDLLKQVKKDIHSLQSKYEQLK